VVWQDVINQRAGGTDAIIGLMLESNLQEGRQDYKGSLDALRYGVSITDACIDWETTEELILSAHDQLSRGAAATSRVSAATAAAISNG
jgi:3-deoxy-7-phosphoheptulonate synthase